MNGIAEQRGVCLDQHNVLADHVPSFDALRIDAAAETYRIATAIRDQVSKRLRRRGVVIGLSGGIDSSVTAALCAAALGAERVLAILMPEDDSDPDSLRLGRLVSDQLGVRSVVEDIGTTLKALGCYSRRDEAIRMLVPEFNELWRCKVALATALSSEGYNLSSLIVQSPDGTQRKLHMPLQTYLAIIAATNMKQRTRKQIEYYHADRLNYVVAGTPNRLEYDQGFFVKNGDGAADIKPIAHLYKSQVYQLAQHLNIPEEIQRRLSDIAEVWERTQFDVVHLDNDSCHRRHEWQTRYVLRPYRIKNSSRVRERLFKYKGCSYLRSHQDLVQSIIKR